MNADLYELRQQRREASEEKRERKHRPQINSAPPRRTRTRRRR